MKTELVNAKDLAKEILDNYARTFTISVLNDSISLLEAQKLTLKNIIFNNKDHEEEIRLKGKIEGVNIAIENLRQEIQSSTSQINEL